MLLNTDIKIRATWPWKIRFFIKIVLKQCVGRSTNALQNLARVYLDRFRVAKKQINVGSVGTKFTFRAISKGGGRWERAVVEISPDYHNEDTIITTEQRARALSQNPCRTTSHSPRKTQRLCLSLIPFVSIVSFYLRFPSLSSFHHELFPESPYGARQQELGGAGASVSKASSAGSGDGS